MTIEPHTAFSDLLRHARRHAGLTQEELAERAGLSTRAISDLERGINRAPRRDTLDMLSEALELSAPELARWRRARKQAAASAASFTAPERHTTNLPNPLTSFMGRTNELEDIIDLLRRPNARLVTVTGTGGVGKTRMALAVGHAMHAEQRNGVWFVNLAPIHDPALVLSTVAATLNIPASDDQAIMDALVTALHAKQMLLILDNFERLVTAAQQITALLSSCPSIKILATSRVALHVPGEQEFLLEPLAVPEEAASIDIASLSESPALALFVERAQAVKPSFAMTTANADAIIAICRRLDGLPLALELAAARIRLLSPHAMLVLLNEHRSFLYSDVQGVPDRHRTLRDTIAWSYDLLAGGEQWLFRALSVFRGGWTLEAAESIAGPQLPDDDLTDVLQGLEHLIDHSLVRVREQPDGTARYTMLEMVREVALQKLEEQGEADELLRKHAAYFRDLAEVTERPRQKDQRQDQIAHRQRLASAHDNLRAALGWAAGQGGSQAELSLRLAGSLTWWWYLHGHQVEGRRWLEQALEHRDQVSPAVLAKGLAAAGDLATAQGDVERCAILAEESLTIWRQLGDKPGMANALRVLAFNAHNQSDWPRAVSFYEEALALYQEIGDKQGIARILTNLGRVACFQEDYVRATTLLQDAIAVAKDSGGDYGISGSITFLGEIARRQGEYLQAAALFREGLALNIEQGNVRLYPECLRGLARSVAGLGQLERAAQLIGIDEALRDALDNPIILMVPTEQVKYEVEVAAVRAQLGDETFDALRAEGRTMPLANALDFALSDGGS